MVKQYFVCVNWNKMLTLTFLTYLLQNGPSLLLNEQVVTPEKVRRMNDYIQFKGYCDVSLPVLIFVYITFPFHKI